MINQVVEVDEETEPFTPYSTGNDHVVYREPFGSYTLVVQAGMVRMNIFGHSLCQGGL